ncbi:MAG: hypothetical protein KBG84_02750 [Planctomycetes bacterium]|nr:hypothetical protein [Planctomycetota bacterium]
MPAPQERFAKTSRVDKAASLLNGWCRVAASEPTALARCEKDLQAALSAYGFESASLPLLDLTPLILDANTVRELTRTVRSLCGIFEQVNKLALTNVAFLRRLEISPSLEALLRREPETRLSLEFARFDFSPQVGGPRLVSLNFDAPRGAMLGACFQREYLLHDFSARTGIARLQPSAPSAALLADLFMAVWRERGSRNTSAPNVAIIDWRETEARPAQELLLNELRERGLVAKRVDPRDFDFRRDEQRLFAGTTRIDMVYRSLTVQDISVRRLPLSAFLEAASEGAVTLVNCLRSRPAGGLAALEVLTSREFDGFFTAAENEIKARLLPWTRRLTRGRTEYLGRDIELPSFVTQRPERFVIKSAGGMSGADVAIGASMIREAWAARVEEGMRRGDVVQEYVPPVQHSCGHAMGLAAGRNLLLSAYAVRGEYAGCSAYCTEQAIIRSHASRLVPVLEVGGRNKTGPIEAGRPTRKRKPTHSQPN